jgi:hypothetical protein
MVTIERKPVIRILVSRICGRAGYAPTRPYDRHRSYRPIKLLLQVEQRGPTVNRGGCRKDAFATPRPISPFAETRIDVEQSPATTQILLGGAAVAVDRAKEVMCDGETLRARRSGTSAVVDQRCGLGIEDLV